MHTWSLKLREAAFFLELLEATELRDESLSRVATQDEEASYLFGAVLGSFYAALDQWHRQTGNNKAYQAFKLQHREIHGSTSQAGWRSLTVHRAHVSMSERAVVSVLGAEINPRVLCQSKLAEEQFYSEEAEVHVARYYVDFKGQRIAAYAFCREHLSVLEQFLGGAATPPGA